MIHNKFEILYENEQWEDYVNVHIISMYINQLRAREVAKRTHTQCQVQGN